MADTCSSTPPTWSSTKAATCCFAGSAQRSVSGEGPFCNGWSAAFGGLFLSRTAARGLRFLLVLLLRELALHRHLHGRRPRHGVAPRNHWRSRLRRTRLEYDLHEPRSSALRYENR